MTNKIFLIHQGFAKILFSIILIFLHQNSFAQGVFTSFDDRKICEENRGNWRKFASGCVDSCEARFDNFALCTKAQTFGCDCSENRCWHEKKCVDADEYKKKYDEKNKKEKEELDALRKERQEKLKTDPAYANYLYNLYPKPVQITAAAGAVGSVDVSNNNPAQNQTQPAANFNQQQIVTQPTQQIIQPVAPIPALTEKPPQNIPPAYMQQQNSGAPINSDGKEQDLVFPVIPLP